MDLLTVAEAAKELNITEGTIRQYCQTGRLGRKIGRQWLITREELEKFKRNRRKPGRPPKGEGESD